MPRIKLPLVHVYRPDHPNHQSQNAQATPTFRIGRVDIELGRRRQPRLRPADDSAVAQQPRAPAGNARLVLPVDSDDAPAVQSAGISHSRFKAVIFDLDNTLADAKLVGKDAFKPAFDAIRHANAAHLSEAKLQNAFDACWHTAFYTVASEHGFSPAMTEAGAKAFRSLTVPKGSGYRGYEDLPLVPLLPLDRYLVTSGFREFQNSKVDTLGIRDHFKAIDIDDPEDHLPDPGPGKTPLFEKIRDEANLESRDVLVVGDNPSSEIAVGNQLGMTTVQVLRPRVEPTSDADYHINSLPELWAVLGLPPPAPAAPAHSAVGPSSTPAVPPRRQVDS